MPKNEIEKREKFLSFCSNVQLRALDTEEGKMEFKGYAVVFNQETVLYKFNDIEYKEVIADTAFDNADISDVPLRYNHARDWVLARNRKKTGEGSLVLTKDEYGIKVTGQFVDMQYARDVYSMIQAGVVTQMSFAFTVRDYSYNSETHTTTINDIDKLFDVSVVDSPAYPQTSISAKRSAEDAEMEIKAKQEAEDLEKSKAEAEQKALELENERNAKVDLLKRRFLELEVKSKF